MKKINDVIPFRGYSSTWVLVGCGVIPKAALDTTVEEGTFQSPEFVID